MHYRIVSIIFILFVFGVVQNKKRHRQHGGKIKLPIYRADVIQPPTEEPEVEINEQDNGTNLPDLMSLFGGTETETGTQYKLFGCVLEVGKDQCLITFTPQEKTCQEKLSLSRLFNFVFKKSKLKDITKNYIPLENFQIQKFLLDKCKGDVFFKTSAKDSFDIVKEKLRVKSGKLEMSFNYKELKKSFTFKAIGIDLTGEVEIGDAITPLVLTKKRDSEEGKFSITTDSISAEDFGKVFSKKEVTETDTSEGAGVFTKAIINKPIISGSRDVNGSYEIILKGKVNGIEGFGEITLFVVVQKQSCGQTSVAVVVDIQNINPTKILSALTGKDLSNIPIIKHITVNLAVEFANNDMMILKDESINKLLVKYIANAKTIAKGTKVKLDIPVKKILQDTGTVASLKHVPESMYAQIFIHEGKACFRFPDNATVDLLNILVALVPKVPDILFNRILKTPPRIIIKKFDVNVETQEIDLNLVAPKQVVLGDNLITLEAAEFELQHTQSGAWNFKIKAKQNIGEAVMEILVQKKGNEFEFDAKISDLTAMNLVKHFGAEKAITTLKEMKFLNFGIENLQISTKFGEKLRLHIKGQPVLFDWKDVWFEGYIIDVEKKEGRFSAITGRKRRFSEIATNTTSDDTDNGEEKTTPSQEVEDDKDASEETEVVSPPEESKYDRKMVFGLLMKQIRLDDIALKLFNKTILRKSWLSDMSCSFTISNTDATKEIEFTTPELKKVLQIKKGIFFASELTIPKDCKGDSLCEIARDKMVLGTKLYLEGAITTTGMSLKAGYRGGGLSFGKNVVLHKAHIVVEIGLNANEFYIEGELKINDPPIIFKGRLAVGVTGKVELRLTMVGMWKKPFGIPYVAFGNIESAMAVYPGVPVPQLELTAEVHVGKIGSNKELKVKAAIGFNPVNPINDFFYAEVNKVTFEMLAAAFGITSQLPKVIMDSGFPEGLITSFTLNPAGKKIQHLNAKIKTGFQFRGMVQLLGLKLRCEILVDFPKKIQVEVEMSPLNIGKGLIKLQRSVKDKENGPKALVAIGLTEIRVRVHGYAELCGLGSEVDIDISDKGMKFFIYGNIFNLFEANVTVSAPYGNGNLIESEFTVGACISASIADVDLAATDHISTAAKKTEEVIEETNEKAKYAGSWYDKASGKFEAWHKSMKEKKEAIQRKAGKLGNIKDVLDNECVDQCDDVCVGAPKWNSKCKQILGVWMGCAEWDSCANMIEDALCVAKCKGTNLYLKGKALKKKVTIELLIGGIEIIKKLLEYAKTLVEHSKGLIDATEKAAQKAEQIANDGKKAMYAVAKYTKANLIDIHHLCFNTTLEQAVSACFSVSVNVTLGGRKNFAFDTKTCMDVSFVKSIGEAISEKLFPGIKAIKSKLEDARDLFKDANSKKEALQKASEEAEKAEKELEGELENSKDNGDNDDDDDEEEDEIQSKKGEVHINSETRSIDSIREQIYTDLPSVFIHDDLTMDAFDRRSPWAFAENDTPFKNISRRKKQVINETQNYDIKENIPLDFDALEDPVESTQCEQAKRLLTTYGTVSSTIRLQLKKLNDEKRIFQNEARMYVEKIAAVEKDVIYHCKRANISGTQTNEANDLLKRMKDGIARWITTVDHQINRQDEKMLKLWRLKFAEILKTNKNIETDAFIETLNKVSTEVAKRHQIPHQRDSVKKQMDASARIVKDLLIGKMGSLSSKSTSIEKLGKNVEYLKTRTQAPCVDL